MSSSGGAAPASRPSSQQIDETSLSWRVFDAFVYNKNLNVTEDELREYAASELEIDLNALLIEVVEAVPRVLVAFMNLWAGWHFKQDFFAGKFVKEHYFNRFKKYMLLKSKIIYRHQDVNTILKQEFSPCTISISCPPSMMNTIAFSNSGDDVIMKQHVGCHWSELTTSQLINWPYVEVSFETPDICFVRKQATEYVRYLNFKPYERSKTVPSIVEHVESLPDSENETACYALRFFQEYVKDYVDALKLVKHVTKKKLEEIYTILTHFLEDIKLINVNKSMVTNTSVLFRLSRIPFIRIRKLVDKTSNQAFQEPIVGYCEIIMPKAELVLVYFKAKQIEGPKIHFEYPQKIRETVLTNKPGFILPHIAYKCTFCNVKFETGDARLAMLQHLTLEHQMEQNVRCTICKKILDVLNLANHRWKHYCMT